MSTRTEEKSKREAATKRLIAFYEDFQAIMERHHVTWEDGEELSASTFRDDQSGVTIDDYELSNLWRRAERAKEKAAQYNPSAPVAG